jgi:hypothetical protein
MKKIFTLNASIATFYSVFLIAISFLFGRNGQAIMLGFVFNMVAVIHFIIMGIMIIANHYHSLYKQRNGHIVSFVFIFFLLLIVNACRIIFR